MFLPLLTGVFSLFVPIHCPATRTDTLIVPRQVVAHSPAGKKWPISGGRLWPAIVGAIGGGAVIVATTRPVLRLKALILGATLRTLGTSSNTPPSIQHMLWRRFCCGIDSLPESGPIVARHCTVGATQKVLLSRIISLDPTVIFMIFCIFFALYVCECVCACVFVHLPIHICP